MKIGGENTMGEELEKKLKSIRKDARGMVGIGTLIVFIAMVIVAAIAAGVLINTSGSLQEQARATGQETIQTVSSGLEVIAVKGQTNNNSEVDNIDVIVRPYSGSRGINLENTVIQYKSDAEMAHLTEDNSITKGETFTVDKIQSTSNFPNGLQLKQRGDISEINIEPENTLGNSETARISIIPNSGFESYYGIIVPSVTETNTWYEL
jgi:flagellin FlaB